MDFKIGYNVKPKEITLDKVVIFEKYNTEGVLIEVTPTKDECEAYGFVYDTKCYKLSNPLIFKSTPTNNLSISKGNNSIGRNTRDNIIAGDEHIIYRDNYSNIISGDANVIKEKVSNTNISGTRAEATASNSIVIGGNQPTDNLAERQTTTLMYGLQTTTGGTQASYLNNLNGSLFAIPTDTAMYFHAEILAVRVGGTATGSPGDYASWLERGVVINKSGVLSIKRARKSMQSDGNHTNWRPTAAVSGTNFVMNVRGDTDMTIEWASTIRFTEIRTNLAL